MFVIPARRNSKGFQFKNRKLLMRTLNEIPIDERRNTIVTTDDEEIIKMCAGQGVIVDSRPEELATDTASMQEVLLYLIDKYKIMDDIILLYLTYPQRDWLDIVSIYNYFKKNNYSSLLCQKEVIDHPYLCMYELGAGRGKQIVEHNLSNRQEYPKVFRISHYIGCFKFSEVEYLNRNLYNENSVFYPIDVEDLVDVDTEADFRRVCL